MVRDRKREELILLTKNCGYNSCGKNVVFDKDNTEGIVYFEEKYYHKQCFVQMCNSRIGNKRFKKHNWQEVLDSIESLQQDAKKRMKVAIDKDSVYRFILDNYRVSCVNSFTFKKLDEIYNGTYKGLAYPISPEELLDEWKFYYPQLIEIRKYKSMDREQAVAYDLAILLGKSAEYREYIERKKSEEQARVAQRTSEYEIDEKAMEAIQRSVSSQRQKASSRTADLFQEVMGNGD